MIPESNLPDFSKMDEMRCPDCKRTIGAVPEESKEPNILRIRLECKCDRDHVLPRDAIIVGSFSPRGVLMVFVPQRLKEENRS